MLWLQEQKALADKGADGAARRAAVDVEQLEQTLVKVKEKEVRASARHMALPEPSMRTDQGGAPPPAELSCDPFCVCARASTQEEAKRKSQLVEAAQEQAAAALANLARDSTDNRVSIVSAGGIPPLLALMSSGSSGAKENTIEAIVQLANRSRSNQDAIATSGGIPLLVASLTVGGGSNKDSNSANTQCSLAASAMWKLAENNTHNKVLIAEAGAIGPLVAMLGSPNAEMCTNAAGII